MDSLQVSHGKITDSAGNPVSLRGTCIGGWMNLEDFINGYPGTESGIRRQVKSILGDSLGEYFFDEMLNQFFNEDDLAFIAQTGANCIRIPLNYRHFESDMEPFVYLETGFRRLDHILGLCEKYNLYAILDLHAVQGWQNCHWHSDNERGASLLWTHRQFQDRLSALWQEIARRYKGRSVIAGYDLMNEPVSNTPTGDHPFDYYENYQSDWNAINRLYRRLVDDIRNIDPDHIIFLEGDRYSNLFSGLDAPFAENLVYGSHNYTTPGFGPGEYPGYYGSAEKRVYWDRDMHQKALTDHEGYQYTQAHQVPLWVGEFGSQYHGPAQELPFRLKNMADQLSVYNQYDVHWTTWTYKDAGVMGWVTLDPDSELSQLIEPIQTMKRTLGAENFVAHFAPCEGRLKAAEMADMILDVSKGDYNRRANAFCFNYAALTGYAGAMLQPAYAQRFKGMNKADITRLMSAYNIRNCVINQKYIDLLKEKLTEA